MKSYVGTKIIRAMPMSNKEFANLKSHDFFGDIEAGHLVEYPDGYRSWSPKEVFEQAYREVSPQEAVIVTSCHG
jgi:hypothetical protein